MPVRWVLWLRAVSQHMGHCIYDNAQMFYDKPICLPEQMLYIGNGVSNEGMYVGRTIVGGMLFPKHWCLIVSPGIGLVTFVVSVSSLLRQ